MSALKICPQCGTEYELDQRFCARDGSTLHLQGDAAGADLVGSIVADRYHIVRKLGEGGMGQVYLAEHVRMGRKSALKVMRPSMVHDADAISRFNREAANASRVSHPHVAAIYDFGETSDGLIYLAMEYVDGEPLTRLIERQGALPPARAAVIVDQVAQALAAAHEFGIVHRDLKPDNIMLTKGRDGGDCVKVVDFGIAKAASGDAQKVTKTGLVVGTPEYMSPEQLAGDNLDCRSDIYALGLVAFNALTGTLPFPSETAQEAMIMRLTDRPRTLAEMKGDTPWPVALQDVMDRALARECAARYQDATQLSREFTQAVGGMATIALSAQSTQVVDSGTPRTRTSAAKGGTVPITAQPGAARAPQPAGLSASRGGGRSRTMAMIGGGVLIAALVGTAIMVMPNTEPDVTTGTAALDDTRLSSRLADSTLAPRDSVPGVARNSLPAAGGVVPVTTKSTDGSRGRRGERVRGAELSGQPSGPVVTQDRIAGMNAELARIERAIDANLENPRREVLQPLMDGLEGLRPMLLTPAQRFRAAAAVAQVTSLLGDDESACRQFRALRNRISNPRQMRAMVGADRARELNTLLQACEPGGTS